MVRGISSVKQVELRDISKSYDQKTTVIQNVNVTIEPGEFFVLVGPSGCGKSTMLRMIAGLEEITSGELYIGNTLATQLHPSKREISMVFQNYALYPHLTVEENIVFGLKVRKVPKVERKKRCFDVAEMLGLMPYLKRKPRELSGGQRQRVALARAIVNESPICLMDEPLSNLDAKLRAYMRSEIRQIQRRLGITMIYVTHDQIEAMTMGDRMMILDHGIVQQIGTPLEIYNQPANPFVATFIGSPPMNLAEAYWSQQGSFQLEGLSSIPVPASSSLPLRDGEKIIVGVRPELIQPAEGSGQGIGVNQSTVEIINVEVLGHETIATFQVQGQAWHAKWSGQWRVQVGDQLPIRLDYQALCLFHGETGKLLKAPANGERTLLADEVMA